MGVHYDKGLVGRIKSAKLVPVTIAVGGDIVWQGGVSVADQFRLIALQQDLQSRYPIEALPAAKDRTPKEPETPDAPTPLAPGTLPGPASTPTDKAVTPKPPNAADATANGKPKGK